MNNFRDFCSSKLRDSNWIFGILALNVAFILNLQNVSSTFLTWLISLGFLNSFLVAILYILYKKQVKVDITQWRFQGVSNIILRNLISRDELKPEIDKQLKNNKIILVVGESGSGKSVLLQNYVFKDNPNVIDINNYSSLDQEFMNHDIYKEISTRLADNNNNSFLESPKILIDNPKEKTTIVFDQFERFINNSNHENLVWFKNLIANLICHSNINVLIAIQERYYYDLKFLDNLLPHPKDTIHITAFNKSEIVEAKRNFKSVSNNKSIDNIIKEVEDNGELLPIEYEIIGFCLSVTKYSFPKTSYEGNKKSQIITKERSKREYLEYYLSFTKKSNRNLALKVLFTLSYGIPLTSETITTLIYGDKVLKVEKYLEALEKNKLVEKLDNCYTIPHDFLKKEFNRYIRLNLGDAVVIENSDFLIKKYERERKLTGITSNIRVYFVPSDIVFTLLFLILSLRQFCFTTAPIDINTFKLTWFISSFPFSNFDVQFLPIYLSHLAWSYYVCMLYRKFFFHIDESWKQGFASHLTYIVCAVCVLIALELTYLWVVSIAVGGLMVGLKFIVLSKKNSTCSLLNNMGQQTLLIMIIILGILVFYGIDGKLHLSYQNSNFAIIITVLMVLYMGIAYKKHLYGNATTKLKGTLDKEQYINV